MLILNTFVETVNTSNRTAALDEDILGGGARDPRLWTTDAAAFLGLVNQAEGMYVAFLQRVMRARSCWGIGPRMATVLEEINVATN